MLKRNAINAEECSLSCRRYGVITISQINNQEWYHFSFFLLPLRSCCGNIFLTTDKAVAIARAADSIHVLDHMLIKMPLEIKD